MSVWVSAAAELLTAAVVAIIVFFSFSFLGKWGPVLGISLAQPIFHLKDPGHIEKKNYMFFGD